MAAKDKLRDLAARAGPVRHRGLRRAAVDDEGAAHRRRGVGGGEPEDVRVLVDALLMLRGEDARRRRALRDDHDEAGERRRAGAPAFRSSSRPASLNDGRPPGTGPMTAKPRSAKSKPGAGRDHADDQRRAKPETSGRIGGRGGCSPPRRPTGRGARVERRQRPARAPRAATSVRCEATLDPEHVAEHRDADLNADAGQKADQHRSRQEIGEESQP